MSSSSLPDSAASSSNEIKLSKSFIPTLKSALDFDLWCEAIECYFECKGWDHFLLSSHSSQDTQISVVQKKLIQKIMTTTMKTKLSQSIRMDVESITKPDILYTRLKQKFIGDKDTQLTNLTSQLSNMKPTSMDNLLSR